MDHSAEIEILMKLSVLRAVHWPPRHAKPLLGGVFGAGAYDLCSEVNVEGGLQHVSYFVRHIASGMNWSSCESKSMALSHGRFRLQQIGVAGVVAAHERCAAAARAEIARFRAEAAQRAQTDREAFAAILPKPGRTAPRRRKQIFEKAGGRCFYCDAVLTLDGKWHIEHRMPRALMGTNDDANLTASCIPCNAKKRDRTDVEYLTELSTAGSEHAAQRLAEMAQPA